MVVELVPSLFVDVLTVGDVMATVQPPVVVLGKGEEEDAFYHRLASRLRLERK